MVDAKNFLQCGTLILMLFGTITHATDPCIVHTTINDVYRSTKYQRQKGYAAKCDNTLADGWYRFKSIAGEMMPETKPSPNSCGTVAPIWIRDTHPTTQGQEKEVTACTNVRDMLNGCLMSSKISIKNCGSFYVYKLKRVYGCPRAYCAGNLQPCPKGQDGIVPNCTVSSRPVVDFPSALVPVPTITYEDNPTKQVTMLCTFQFSNWKNVTFGIEWFTDGYSVKNETMVCDAQTTTGCFKRSGTLPAMQSPDKPYFQPGHRIRCKVRVKYNTNVKNKWSTLGRQSKEYFVGIEVIPHNKGRLKECNANTKITVTFKPTVPIFQNIKDQNNKKVLPIRVIVPTGYTGQTTRSAVSQCKVNLPHGMLPTETRSIEIRPICDNVNQPDGSMDYHFVIDDLNIHSFWMLHKLPSIKVAVDNTEQKECSATGDPHYTTFDGRYYDYMPIGDYIMYKNTATDTEIHSRTWLCTYWSNNPSCNCGVAIREGTDIIIFSVCNENLVTQPRPLKTEIRSERGLATGTHITRTVQGSTVTYNVLLPSGTRVKVERYYWGISLYIKSFKAKPNSIVGLCGNSNGDWSDEFDIGRDNKRCGDVVCFGNSWRLERKESNFNLFLPAATPGITQLKWCECRKKLKTFHNCKYELNTFQDFRKSGKDIAKQFQNRHTRSLNGAFYTDDIMDYEDKSFFVDEEEAQFALARIRTRRAVMKQAMSKENATNYCKAIIEDSTAGKTCNDVPGFNFTAAMTSCVTDLELSGDIKFAGAAFDTMKDACEEVALKNVSLYKIDASGKMEPPAAIGDNLCPGDCSNHGNCTNRTCICEEGYTSNDCSMSINAVPELLGIYDGGLCDIRKRPCRKTDIFGRYFIDSENLTCHVREFKVISSRWVPKPVAIQKSGEMIDIFGVRCDLPDPPTKLRDFDSEGTPAGGLWISISNDGEHQSERQMRFISYDSVCMACNKTGNCTLKEKSCSIHGHCFASTQWNPRDWCQQCIPGNSQKYWTRRKNNTSPAFEQNQTTRYAIAGEGLPLQVKAKDPDNRPVTYSLISSTARSGYNFSSTGLLQWNVTSKEDFTFQVTDECNATDTITITVRIVACPCKNGGQCSPHPCCPRGSGLYSCKCPKGFSGDKCETNIDDCVSVNCGNGTCIDGINNYTCRCNPGFKGSVCNQKIYKCTNQSCFTGVQCTETASGITCGPCPIGMSGDGKTCSAPTTTSSTTTVVTTKAPSTTNSPTAAATTKAPSTTNSPTTAATTEAPTTTSSPTTAATTEAPTTTSSPTTAATTKSPTTTSSPTTAATTKSPTTTSSSPTTVATTKEQTAKPTTVPTTRTEPTTELKPTTVEGSPLPTDEVTNPPRTTGEIEGDVVKAELSIKMEWEDVYLDKESQEFKFLAQKLESDILDSYRNSGYYGLKIVKVISMRQGSIIIEFELVFDSKPSDPLQPLKKSIEDAKMGKFTVDPESLKMKNEATDEPNLPAKKDLTLILILVGLGIVILLVATIVLVRKFQNRPHASYRLRKSNRSGRLDENGKDILEMEAPTEGPIQKKAAVHMESGSNNAGFQ